MIKLLTADISTFLEPSTTASATAVSAGFFDNAALGALAVTCRGYTHRRGRFCRNTDVKITKKTSDHQSSLWINMVRIPCKIVIKPIPFNSTIPTRSHPTNKIKLSKVTFASVNALSPSMSELHVASISTLLEPSTAASATAAFARVLGSSAIGTYDSCHF